MKVTPLRKNVRLGIVLSLLVKPPIKKKTSLAFEMTGIP